MCSPSQHAVSCWPGEPSPHPRLCQSFRKSAGSQAEESNEPCSHYWLSVTFSHFVFFFFLPLPPPFYLRPIMLYQIPWPLEQSRRWTLYMPLLNVNNRSLTSTSERDTLSLMHTYLLQQISPCRFSWIYLAVTFFCRFVGRINIYKDKEEPVARWVCFFFLYLWFILTRTTPFSQLIKCLKWCSSNILFHSCRPLGAENLLLRGATLKNTQHIYGSNRWIRSV